MDASRVQVIVDEAGSFSGSERAERVHVVRGRVGSSVRAPGPVLLAEGARVDGDLDARGAVHLARGASVGGSIRAMGDVVLGAHSRVYGDIRVEGRLFAQRGALVSGAADVAMDAHLAAGCRLSHLHVGGDLSVDHPVIAPKVRVAGRLYEMKAGASATKGFS